MQKNAIWKLVAINIVIGCLLLTVIGYLFFLEPQHGHLICKTIIYTAFTVIVVLCFIIYSLRKYNNSQTRYFIAELVHELKNPLAAIKIHACNATYATSRDETIAALENVKKGIERASSIVNQLLLISQARNKGSNYYKDKVNLNKQASLIIAEMLPLAKEKNITLQLITSSKPLFIKSNTIMIDILIKNLIDNSIRYIPKDGIIKIIIESINDIVNLSVIDNGPGIPQELRKKVLDRFYQINGTKNHKGIGLGLSIVKEIVAMSKAKLELNTPASGAGLQVSINFKKIS